MALGFSVNVYGTVDQQPPYAADVNGVLPSVNAIYPTTKVAQMSFSTGDAIDIAAINPGVKMVGGVFCYGVVQVLPTGLNQQPKNYVVKETISVLTTLRG